MTYKRKLIEVALPLEAINVASAREKSIRRGHPSTLHQWWARRPLAACRAVLFASIVDDPSAHPEQFPTVDEQEVERQRLFRIIEDLVIWENSGNAKVLAAARAEILRSTDGNPPPVLDPFCGGGSIPLEARRLGLEAHASDLNPVAVLITKALVEIPPRFADRPPVHPEARDGMLDAGTWERTQGMAEDVRRYGAWMRLQARGRIGDLYPRVKLPADQGGGDAPVIAWLWARSVTCPNPACGAQMPLVHSFWLSKQKGNLAWVEPITDSETKTVQFEVRTGEGAPRPGTKDRQGGRCLYCGTAVSNEVLRSRSRDLGIRTQLLAVVAEGQRGRVYVSAGGTTVPSIPDCPHDWLDQPLPSNPRWFSPPGYGMTTFAQLFTPRQLVALTTFSGLVGEARERVVADAMAAGLPDDGVTLENGGSGATAYADAVASYLAFSVSKAANLWSSIASWMGDRGAMRETFARQAIPMVWDFAEANPFSNAGGGFDLFLERVTDALGALPGGPAGVVRQVDAASAIADSTCPLVSTDPPYYDNIGYADLSDYFYVWLRRSLKGVYPQLMSTLLVPKAQELVATPQRFGGDKAKAQAFFEIGLGAAFIGMREIHDARFPLTVYYAFKQAESDDDAGLASTGWETMLEGLLAAGFSVLGTWPMRTEGAGRAISQGTNALASSIVLVCRPRPLSAAIATRSEFVAVLRRTLPEALRLLQNGNIAPVDLAQAAIGPGMGQFSSFAKVVEADGSAMSVRAALSLVNQVLDEVLSEQDSEYDPATRWALAWFEQQGFASGGYGVADVLAKAKAIAVDALAHDGFVESGAGKVRLLTREELSSDWDPVTDRMLTAWEVAQHLVLALERGGERSAAALLVRVGPANGEIARDLAYRLFSVCEKKGWSREAMPFNALVVAWPEIVRLAASGGAQIGPVQSKMEI